MDRSRDLGCFEIVSLACEWKCWLFSASESVLFRPDTCCGRCCRRWQLAANCSENTCRRSCSCCSDSPIFGPRFVIQCFEKNSNFCEKNYCSFLLQQIGACRSIILAFNFVLTRKIISIHSSLFVIEMCYKVWRQSWANPKAMSLGRSRERRMGNDWLPASLLSPFWFWPLTQKGSKVI